MHACTHTHTHTHKYIPTSVADPLQFSFLARNVFMYACMHTHTHTHRYIPTSVADPLQFSFLARNAAAYCQIPQDVGHRITSPSIWLPVCIHVCMYICIMYVCIFSDFARCRPSHNISCYSASCMYVCMYVCTDVLCMYVCTYVLCMYVWFQIAQDAGHRRTSPSIWLPVRMCLCIYVHMYCVCMCACMSIQLPYINNTQTHENICMYV
jgi:hypothetical protein